MKSPKWDRIEGLVRMEENREAEEIQSVTYLKQFLKRNVYILRGI